MARILPTMSDLRLDSQDRPPLFFIGPDSEYAAVFPFGGHAAVLESIDGRRVSLRPYRGEYSENPYEDAAQFFVQKGFKAKAELSTANDPEVLAFMTEAGFTPAHVLSTFDICDR